VNFHKEWTRNERDVVGEEEEGGGGGEKKYSEEKSGQRSKMEYL